MNSAAQNKITKRLAKTHPSLHLEVSARSFQIVDRSKLHLRSRGIIAIGSTPESAYDDLLISEIKGKSDNKPRKLNKKELALISRERPNHSCRYVAFCRSTQKWAICPYLAPDGGPAYFYPDSAEYHKRLASPELRDKIVCCGDDEKIEVIDGVDGLFDALGKMI